MSLRQRVTAWVTRANRSDRPRAHRPSTAPQTDGPQDRTAAAFLCAECGAVAATIIFVRPGESDPRLTPSPEGAPAGVSKVFADFHQLSIIGGPASYTIGVGKEVERVEAAVTSGNIRLLYELDEEFVPFWCPKCEACYCREHYVHWAQYDEGFFDCIRGRCPLGHERTLVD